MFSGDVEVVLGALVLVWVGLQYAARRWPEIEWLQAIKLRELSPRQKRIAERRSNLIAGMQFILMGVVIPAGYVVLTVMMFNDFGFLPTLLVLLSSAVCVVLGIFAIAKNARG